MTGFSCSSHEIGLEIIEAGRDCTFVSIEIARRREKENGGKCRQGKVKLQLEGIFKGIGNKYPLRIDHVRLNCLWRTGSLAKRENNEEFSLREFLTDPESI